MNRFMYDKFFVEIYFYVEKNLIISALRNINYQCIIDTVDKKNELHEL